MPAVELKDVTKTFDTVTAVDPLPLVVPKGSIYGFIGPNGSGKTTTLRMIMNIFYPDRGDIGTSACPYPRRNTLVGRGMHSFVRDTEGRVFPDKMPPERLVNPCVEFSFR